MKVVCVVDDEPKVRKSLDNLLRSVGLRAVCFESGEAFLASRWPEQADALLLDVRMPGLKGAEVQALLAERRCPLPVICMSAEAGAQGAESALARGAHAFLAKPFSAEALLAALAGLPGWAA
ncbi:Response regulator receiver domain-containing protein [Metapseudomonas otitidis]|nr:Response regulator receiver domain-containing protein [Pseudomonas otitidis]